MTNLGPGNARFFVMPGVPSNIATTGWTSEEAASTRGKPHPSIKNPALNPMMTPTRAKAAGRLLATGREKADVDAPEDPSTEPDSGAPTELVESRSAALKMKTEILNLLSKMADPTLEQRIQHSVGSVIRLRDELAESVGMTEAILSARLAGSRG
jgi:hypothetical protein